MKKRSTPGFCALLACLQCVCMHTVMWTEEKEEGKKMGKACRRVKPEQRLDRQEENVRGRKNMEARKEHHVVVTNVWRWVISEMCQWELRAEVKNRIWHEARQEVWWGG